MLAHRFSVFPIACALVLIALVVCLNYYQHRTIPAISANADKTLFSGERAFGQLAALIEAVNKKLEAFPGIIGVSRADTGYTGLPWCDSP